MIKIWTVKLRKSYNLDDGKQRKLEVAAKNPTEAIRKAISVQKKQEKLQGYNLGYRYAISVELIVTESVPR